MILFSAEVPPKKEPLPALVRRRAEGVEMQDVADPTYGMKPLCERGAKLWKGIDTKMYEMQPLEADVGSPSGNFSSFDTYQSTVIVDYKSFWKR